MEIYLLRHTRVALGREYCYGISDIDLADTKEEDIRQAAGKLRDIRFDRIYSSPLKRCRAMAEALKQPVEVVDDLVEMGFGDWELKKWSEIDKAVLDRWMSDFVNIAPPNGEAYLDFSMKSVLFFDKLVAGAHAGEKILLITHSGPIRAIICHILNLSLAHSFNFEVDYGSLSKAEVVDQWYKVKYLNR